MRKTRKYRSNKKALRKKITRKRQYKRRKASKKNVIARKKIIAETINYRINESIKQKMVTVGIMTAPWLSNTDSHITSYMAASYIKWLESAGALVVPIEFDLPKPKILGLLRQLNGVVLIGGGIDNSKTHTHEQFLHYQDAVNYVINYSIYQNGIGNYYPLWCTCMSFELAAIFLTENRILKHQKSISEKFLEREGQIGPSVLKWTKKKSKLRNIFTNKEISEMSKKDSIFQAHSLSITCRSKLSKKLSKVANIVAVNTSVPGHGGKGGVKYISIYELKKYPIYGVQFHPEKPPFEYVNDHKRVPKTDIAITISNKMARFFINECKKNSNVWIGGKRFFDFTINDYNVYNKTITNRLKHLHLNKITSNNVGDAGIYLFGPSIIPIEGDILNNPWKTIITNDKNDPLSNSHDPDNP